VLIKGALGLMLLKPTISRTCLAMSLPEVCFPPVISSAYSNQSVESLMQDHSVSDHYTGASFVIV